MPVYDCWILEILMMSRRGRNKKGSDEDYSITPTNTEYSEAHSDYN